MTLRLSLWLSTALAALGCSVDPPTRSGGPAAGWPVYAGSSGGMRYSPLDEIRRDNVRHLEVAWEYHTPATRKGKRHVLIVVRRYPESWIETPAP